VHFRRQASDAGRSVSPASDAGNASDDRTDFKGKAKAKGKRAGEVSPSLSFCHFPTQQPTTIYLADESDFTLKRKRVLKNYFPLVYNWLNLYCQPESPHISPNKKSKKGKVSGMFLNLLWAIRLMVTPFILISPRVACCSGQSRP
jgi:hypothetical protein